MTRNLLLVADDSPDSRRIIQLLDALRDPAYAVEWVRTRAAALERVATTHGVIQARIDVLLLDLSLADSQGLETFESLFQVVPHLPILVLCIDRDEDVARLAVHRGAQDFLVQSRVDGYSLPKMLDNTLERAAISESLFKEKERAQVTLDSIGDAVVCTDTAGMVTYFNFAAERMTGCTRAQAEGVFVDKLFRLVDSSSGAPIENPLGRAIRDDTVVGLTTNCALVRTDRVQVAIEDSAAPIHDRHGRVIGGVMVFHDVTAARTLALKMAYQAEHDTLTDLPNRAVLKDRLVQAMALAIRNQTRLALLFLDLDRFKNVNDTLGHGIGDRLLQSVAQRLIACVRGSDTVSRQGGDEFVILISQIAESQDAAVFAAKVSDALAAPHVIEAHHLHVTASIGIALFPDDGDSAEVLMKNADLAMYVAKDRGRHSFQFFDPAMDGLAIERQSIENDLRHAIDRQELDLHYQPVVDLATRRIVGAEALLRWQHPTRGLVPASHFIPIAEERGLIAPIGRWTLERACAQLHAWRAAGLPPIRMAVNVSTVNLREADFAEIVRTTLDLADVAPSELELELTETFLMQDPASTATVLHALRRMGVSIALDDFGTGYSSLSYLKRFPIATLKIDHSFVRDVVSDADDAGIVTAVIGLGRTLDLDVIAEGVESGAQLAFLIQRGCPAAQGHLFSPAINAEDFARLLERGIDDSAWPTRDSEPPQRQDLWST